MDYKVLEQLNLEKYKVSLVAIETHHVNGMQSKDYNKILNFFKKYNFSLMKRLGPTSLFCKR